MKLKKIIPIFMSIILLGTLYNIKAMDPNRNFESFENFENLPGDVVGEILKNMANPESISNISQNDIRQIRRFAVLNKDNPKKVQFSKKAAEALDNLKNATCQYLNQFLNEPERLINETERLDTEFSKLCFKEIINTNSEISEKIADNFIDAIVKDQLERVKFLAEVAPNVQNNHKITALMAAAARGNKNIAELLLDHKAKINLQDNDGKTALRWAVWSGNPNIIEFLLEHGADSNIKDNNGHTAFMAAVVLNDNNIVKLLLDHKAKIDLQDNNGQTALMGAAFQGNKNIVELLLDHKAKIDLQDKYGNTAYNIALDNHYEDIAELLKQN